jgi:hypothetical protein
LRLLFASAKHGCVIRLPAANAMQRNSWAWLRNDVSHFLSPVPVRSLRIRRDYIVNKSLVIHRDDGYVFNVAVIPCYLNGSAKIRMQEFENLAGQHKLLVNSILYRVTSIIRFAAV